MVESESFKILSSSNLIMKIDSEKVSLLYTIDEGMDDPKTAMIPLRDNVKNVEKGFAELEKNGYIKIEWRSGKIYNSELTEKGKEALHRFYHLIRRELL